MPYLVFLKDEGPLTAAYLTAQRRITKIIPVNSGCCTLHFFNGQLVGTQEWCPSPSFHVDHEVTHA